MPPQLLRDSKLKGAFRRGLLLACVWALTSRGIAADPPSTVGPLLGLLKQGKLPAERLPGVVKLVCERGNEHDLAYVFSQAAGDAWSLELRRQALDGLRTAAATRKVRPVGEFDGLAGLISESHDAELRSRSIQLAGLWKASAAVVPLQELATDPTVTASLRQSAIEALIVYGGDVARQTIDALLADSQPLVTRLRGATALVAVDQVRAGPIAAKLLQQATSTDDPGPLVDAFLNVQGGADRLAAELRQTPPPPEVALLALRHMYAVGRSDASLDAVLSERAGIKGEAPKLTEEQIKQLAERAVSQGDAARGEAVFRRADLACLRCHAVSKAGGQIGPDLSALGASSPVDYVAKSIYDPDAQKKEEFVTRILVTLEGQQLTGIVTKRTAETLTLKTADGKLVDVAAADIDFEGVGKSLMPEGLVKFMTEQEILDLVKFLSTLGKPGTPYEIRQTQRMQRWRVLKQPPPRAVESVPDEELLGDLILAATTWEPAYARVSGELPLPELVARSGAAVVYVQGEVDVSAGGEVLVQLDSTSGLTIWLNDSVVSLGETPRVTIAPGRHMLTLRIDTEARETAALKLELVRAPGSTAQFSVVDGS